MSQTAVIIQALAPVIGPYVAPSPQSTSKSTRVERSAAPRQARDRIEGQTRESLAEVVPDGGIGHIDVNLQTRKQAVLVVLSRIISRR
jgi:hypothetical protein